MASIMLSCGEPSGDVYAGALTRALHAHLPDLDIFGFGGPELRAAGAELIGDYRGFSVTGLSEALRVVPRSLRMIRRLTQAAAERRPRALVVVDFPDFNFRLGRAVHALGIPVVYYISPQFWAWRPGRLHTIKAFARKVLVIFPFEAPIYERAGVDVEFVGHPLLELAHAPTSRTELLGGLGLDPSAPTVALLPGSRRNELQQILPTLVQAVPLIGSRVKGAQFLVARAPQLDDDLLAPVGLIRDHPVRVVEARTDDVLAASDVVITASGTATVQTALHGTPFVIVYRLSPLTYRIGRRFVKVDTFGMVNLLAGRRVVTELIQDAFTPQRTADEAIALLTDAARAERMRADLAEVVRRLGGKGASARAAASVLRVAGLWPGDAASAGSTASRL